MCLIGDSAALLYLPNKVEFHSFETGLLGSNNIVHNHAVLNILQF